MLEKINNAAIKLLAPLSLEEVYGTIVKEAIKLVDGEYGSILLEQKGELRRVYSSSQVAFKTIPRRRGNTFAAFKTQKVVIAPIAETGSFHPELIKSGIASTIFIPLSYHLQKAIGVLTINAKRPVKNTRDEIRMLKLFGTMATLSIKKSQMYQDLTDALETRDLFISLASHELRTPMTSINGYIQLLYNRLGNGTGIESRWIKDLYEENLRLTNLVKELLEVNRIKQGQLHFMLRECSIREVIQKAVEQFSRVFPGRQVIIQQDEKEKDLPDIVIGDFDKLLQVMSAVLQNAAKFSGADLPITIRLKKQKNLIKIDVIDKGIGITKKDLPHIFEGFYKVGETPEGMGVGLLLAKHIVSYHRGTIAMTSTHKKGAKISIKLPLTHHF